MPNESEASRKEFPVTKLADGFAAATPPVTGQTITTDAKGLEAGEISVPAAEGEIPGYRAMPREGANFPVVLVVQEIFGVHEHIRDVCRRLAKRGYCAVSPELFARQGDVSRLADIQDVIRDVASKVPDEQVMSDLDATAAWAAESSKGDPDRLGITGFCWGGRIVWLYAAHNPRLKAGVAWYGRLTGSRDERQPKQPLDVAGSIKAPVLGLYGGADQSIPLATVEEMRAALKAAGSPSEIVAYPGAPHAFHADYRPSYRKDAAEDGWNRLLAWFKKYGV